MHKRWTWLALVLVATMAFWGCSDDDGGPAAPAPLTQQTAFEAMAEAGAQYINDNAQCPGVLAASALNANLNDYTVIDIRSQTDYDAGHIPGAYHSSLGTLITDLASIPNNKPYVIVCKTGQTAGHAKLAMELLGYGDVYSLKFGMADWHSSLSGPWTSNCGDNLTNPGPETTNNNSGLVSNGYPSISGDAGSIVETRVAWMLQQGFKAVSYADIRDNLDDYFILNYFGQADYEGTGSSGVPGHIPGAYQFTPYASLGIDQMLNNLPTDKTIVVYCWTGQHSSQVTAYLNMLGYDAVSLKFGSNNLFHSDLTGHKWNSDTSNTFTLE
jgi:rhodanese-related sulfurtransferase